MPDSARPARQAGSAAMTGVRETTRFLEPRSKSRDLTKQAVALLPGGISREAARRHPHAPVMAAGYGPVLVDVDGDERADFVFNGGALIHGHGWAPVTDAVTWQAARLTAAPFPAGLEAELARMLARRVPVDNPLFRFTASGSEAVLLALRLASVATRRRKIVIFEHCDHGSFVPSAQSAYPPRDYLLCPFNTPALLRQIFENDGRGIAAVLADLCPVRGALSPATAEFAAEIRDCCARYQALLIADEVTSARAAPGGMAARYGLRPDIVCLGGWIGGGLPAGAVAMRPELGRYFTTGNGPRLGHDGTFSGSPLSMAAGIAVVDGFGPARAAELDAATAALCQELGSMFARHRSPWTARQSGSLFCLWPHPDPPLGPSQANHHATRRKIVGLSDWLLQHGAVLAPTGFGCLSTATGPDQTDYLVQAIGAYLTAG